MDKSTTNLVRASAVIVIFASIATIFQDEFRNLKLKVKEQNQLNEIIAQNKAEEGTEMDKLLKCEYLKQTKYRSEYFKSIEKCKTVVLEIYDVCSKEADNATNDILDILDNMYKKTWNKCALNRLKKAGAIQ